MPDELNLCLGQRKREISWEVDEFLFHVFVDVAVAGEGFAAFLLTAEGSDKIGALTFLTATLYFCELINGNSFPISHRHIQTAILPVIHP